jgi:hypothetical protein
MSIESRIKLFGMSHQLVERELDKIESQLDIDLQRSARSEEDRDDHYYPQFPENLRNQAAQMGDHYELFYILEQSIRGLISEKLEAEKGPDWWNAAVPEPVRKSASENVQRELDSGVTRRSDEEIDYITFGELGEIVRANWQTFSDTFNSQKGFGRVMTSLNVLRGPIAHCSRPLAPDEVVRLRLTVGDWFRLME